MLSVFLSVLPIFLLIVTGYVAKRWFVRDEQVWGYFEKLTYYLFFPALLINELSKSNFNQANTSEAVIATVAATLVVAVLIFISKRLFSIDDALFTSIFQGGVRYNSYVFIAMSQSLYGTEGVALSGIFIAYMIVLTNILSVIVMNTYGEGSKKSLRGAAVALMKNPLIVSALLGLVLNAAGFRPAGAIADYLGYLAHAATPLSLMAVGAGLIVVMDAQKVAATLYSVVLKLLAMPAFTLVFIKVFAATGLAANIALLYAAVPCAGNAYILARQMGGDAESMASIITWTTVFSALTITLLLGGGII
ncbi:MAG: AEC family transporter [Pseudomonas sp.]|uniref:AEC family transporter n=1 Tax=Pseudomonas sp. TaxID=306 RepID=UPI003392EA04